MKLCIVFAIAATLFGVAMSETPAEIRSACMAEAKISEADLKKLEADKTVSLPPTENYKCYTRCFLVKRGAMKGDVYDGAMAIKTIQAIPAMKGLEADIVKAITACKDLKGANPCDMAYNIFTCVKKQGIFQRFEAS